MGRRLSGIRDWVHTLIRPYLLAFIALFCLLSSLSLYRHHAGEPNTFQSEIWADRAGYYVYLPATFLYTMQPERFPEKMDSLTGNGFELNLKDGKVFTKYSNGVAILQMPFFVAAHLITIFTGQPADGFSFYYRKSINLAAATYLTLGLLLLYSFLTRIVPQRRRAHLLSIALLFLGTNLYYYGIVATGMSHVYSFFLFAAFAYLSSCKVSLRNSVLLGLCAGFIVLIRPTNLIFLPFPWLLHTHFAQRNTRTWLISIVSAAFVFLPQLFYWHYLSGSWFFYSYGSEGFSNAFHPQIARVLLAPHNGMLPYAWPLLLIPFAVFRLYKYRKPAGVYSAFAILIIIYLSAAWHDPAFGCGAGLRNVSEYMALLALPYSLLIHRVMNTPGTLIKRLFAISLLLLALISFKINYHFYGCYPGDIWEWRPYFAPLFYPFPWL